VSTLLNAGYFLPVIYRAFRRPEGDGAVAVKEAPWPIVVALAVTAALTILLFMFPGVPWRLAQMMLGG
jgi:multicomponent Na+:H+ antiporter subunit D